MTLSPLLIVMLAWGWPEVDATAREKAPAPDEQTVSVDWPQFRGPDGQGHGSGKPPAKWSEISNIGWKTELPGRGWSSPVIHGDHIWLTTALNDGSVLKALRINKSTGKLDREISLFQSPTPGKIHPKNGYASPTPIIDGNRIFVHFGALGTACLDGEGEILWKTKLDYYHHHGPAASPILVGERLIIPCDGLDKSFYDKEVKTGVTDFQFLVALDVKTGDLIWKKSRQAGRHSYATPLLIEVNGQQQIISPAGDRVIAYSPDQGEEIWSVRFTGYSLIPRPVFGHGLLFICTGYDSPQLLAIRPDGKVDVTDSHVEWTCKQGVPNTPSPILVGDELYFVSDGGVATCLDAQTGKQLWKRRLGGNYSASPIAADGKIYFVSEEGETHVLIPGKQYKRLAVNKVNGTTFASLAVSDNALFLRSDKALYRIEEKSKATPKPAPKTKVAGKSS